jgi:HEAT repeat protein
MPSSLMDALRELGSVGPTRAGNYRARGGVIHDFSGTEVSQQELAANARRAAAQARSNLGTPRASDNRELRLDAEEARDVIREARAQALRRGR